MTTLSDFLLVQFDEDEHIARGAERTSGTSWVAAGLQSPFDARMDDHIARWDPARVLAECEAKRRIVELHRGKPYPRVWLEAVGANPEDELVDLECTTFGADLRWPHECRTLRLLALPYADHPGYDESWRP